jgi:DNA-binding response OmpR family regulator
MQLRAVIIDDEPSVRQSLEYLCARRGYEVLTFPGPGHCPLYVSPPCPCPRGTACADLLLVDQYMLEVDGLGFIAGLRTKGCVGLQIAALSGAWPPAARVRAIGLGCRLFRKPFELPELFAWFDSVEAQVEPRRVLLDWPNWEERTSFGPGAPP